MADQYKYDYEKKKWIKVSSSTPSRGETNRNGRSGSTSSTNKSGSATKTGSSGAKSTTSGKTSTGSSTSSRTYSRGETNRSSTTSTPKYNTYSKKSNSYSYSPKNSTTAYRSGSSSSSYSPSSSTSSYTQKSTPASAAKNFFDSMEKNWSDWLSYVRDLSKKDEEPETKIDHSGETDREREQRRYLASAGNADLGNVSMEDIVAGKKALEEQMYKPGAKNNLDFTKFQTGKMAKNTDTWRDNLIAGIDTFPMSKEDQEKLLAEADMKADYAGQTDAIARARTGDMSALDGLSGKSRGEVARAGRLWAYDTIGENMAKQLPEDQRKESTVLVDIPVDYDLEKFYDDRFVHLYGEHIGGGTVTAQERQEAKKRLELVTGIEDVNTVTDWSKVSFEPDHLSDMQKMNRGAETYADLWNMTGSYTNEDVQRDMMTVLDYQRGHQAGTSPFLRAPEVNDDEYDRAVERLYAMTGVDMSDAGNYERNAAIATSIDEMMRRTAAEPIMQATGNLPEDVAPTGDDYQAYLTAYAKQQADLEKEAQDAAALDQLMADKWGSYSGGKYSPRERGWTGTYSDADLIYELVAAGDDEERRAEVIWSGTNAVGNDFALNRRFNAGYQFMTDEDRAKFFKVWELEGPERALEYLDDLSPKLLKAENKRKEESYTEFANQNPFAANAMARLGTMVSAAEYIPNLISNALTGKQFSDAGARFTQTVTSETAQNIAEATPNANLFGRNIPALLYQAGTSAADSGLLALSGNPALATAVLSTSAANATLTSKLDAGESLTDAVRDSAAVGMIEMITEKYSVEALMSDPSSLLGYIGKNIVTEGAEEMTSEVLNIGYDMLAYGDDSEVAQRFRELVVQGYTPDEAYSMVAKEKAGDVLESGAVGAISGGMGAGPRSVTTAVTDASAGKNLQKNESAQSLLDFAGKMLPEGDVRNMANELMGAIKDGGKISNSKLGRVYRELLGYVDEQTRQVLDGTMVRNVRDQLREMGENSRELADSVMRVVAGDGSAKPMDYAVVGANDAARAVAKSLTDKIDYAKGLMEKAGEFVENAGKKTAPEKEAVPAAEAETAEVETAAENGEAGTGDVEFEGMTLSDNEVSTTSDGEEVSITGAESVGTDGELMLKVKTADGTEKTVKASEVTLGTADEDTARLAVYSKEYGAGAASMFNARLPSQNVDEYAAAFQKAVQYGSDGRNIDTVSGYDSMKVLNRNQLGIAYEMGRAERVERSRLTQQHQSEKMTANGPVKVGSVDISGIKSISGLSKHQRRSIVTLRNVAELLGINIEVFESTANEDGKYTGKQGSWDPKTLTLALDIHAGSNNVMNVHSAMMHTAGHELTHMIYQFADSDIRAAYQEYVLGALSQKMTEDELNYKIDRAMKLPGVANRDAAIEEIVAEASVEAFSKITEEDIAQLAETNQPLLRRIRKHVMQWVANMKKRIAKAFAGTEAKNEYAKMMNDQLDEMARMWNSALINATENKNAQQKNAKFESRMREHEMDGLIDDMDDAEEWGGDAEFAVDQKTGAVVAPNVAEFMAGDDYAAPDNGILGEKFSVRETDAWAEAHREQYPDDKSFEQNLALVQQFDRDVVANSVARYLVPHGRIPKSRFGPLRNNVEYRYTFDMDTKCERTYQFLFYRDAVQKKIGRQLTENESRSLIELMRAYGQMIPCTYCYVEGKRMKLAELYMKYIKKNGENIMGVKRSAEEVFDIVEGARSIVSGFLDDRFNTEENYVTDARLASGDFAGYRDFVMPVSEEAAAQEIYERYGITDKAAKRVIAGYVAEWVYNRRMDVPMNLVNTEVDFRTDGIDERVLAFHDLATKAAQGGAKAKGIENYEPYIDQLKNISEEDKRYMVGMGGIRKHSSNDFQIQNVQDYMLFFMDLAADKRGGVSWTGHTYTKNLDYARIFAPTRDRINVSIAMYGDNASGIRPNTQEGVEWEELKKVRKQYKNVGAMAMVTNNDQLSFALNSDWIDMIIPFHASGMKRSLYYDVLAWTDYTSKQSERLYTKGQMIEKLRQKGIRVSSSTKAAEVQRLFMENFDISVVYNEKTGKRVAPHFFPGETVQHGVTIPGHNNDPQRYFELCEQYGTNPRFFGVKVQNANGETIDVTKHPAYLKLIKETARTDTPQEPIVAEFDMDYVRKAMSEFKGYGSLAEDSYGIVDEFVREYIGKDRKVGYLTERAQQYKEIREEMAAEEAEKRAKQRAAMMENINKNDPDTASESEFADDSDLKFSPRFYDVDVSDSQISANINDVLSMNSVIALKGDEVNFGDGNLQNAVLGYYNEIGGKAFNPTLGDVTLNNRSIRNARGHGMYPLKAIAFYAVPTVIEEGKIINYDSNWQGTGQKSYIIAAPVNVTGGRLKGEYWMGVIVLANADSQRFYTHDAIAIKKEGVEALKTGTNFEEIRFPGGNKPSLTTILQKLNSVKPGARYQLRDPDQISDRELLANVMDSAAETQAELDFVRRYRAQIQQLNEKQRDLEQTRQEIADARKNGARKSDIAVLENKAKILRNQIDRMDGKLLEFEAGKPLKAVVKRQRDDLRRKANERMQKRVAEVRQQEAAKRDEMRERISKLRDEKNARIEALKREKAEKVKEVRDEKNESFARQKYLAEVKAGTDKLREMVTTPTNKKHVPEILRKPMAEFLDAFDFASKRQLEGGEPTKADRRMADAYDAMRKAIERMQKQQSGIDATGAEYFSGYLDLPNSYIEEFDNIMVKVRAAIEASGRISDTPIHQMESKDLHELAKLLRILHSSINKMNKTLANAKYATADAAAEDSMADLGEVKMGKERNKLFGKMVDFIDWKNATPYYAFERFGRGGKAIFESLMDGWDKLAFNAQKLVEFTESVYTPKEVSEWESEIKDVKLSSGETVRMSAAQVMGVYCLAKRAQAVGHLMGGGIRVSDIEGKRGKVISQTDNYTIYEEDIEVMRGLLTDRQCEVADKLQEHMSTQGSEWGNEVSMKRFGYRMFTEPHYYPIESDKNNMQEKDEEVQENSLLRLLNMSATKDLTKGANNAIVIRSIFDVYTSHMSDMAKYSALGLQILDAMKWLNYVERTEEVDKNGEKTGKITTRSVRKALENAYGAEARRYIVSFIRNLNGDVEAGLEDDIFNRVTSNYKVAAVGANLRVGMLQITSMPRAATAIDPKYLMAGLAKWNARRGKTSKQAIEKVGIAKWKSMGFYDTNISRNLRQMIKHDETTIDKVREGSMKLAEWGDAWTMGVLYGAVESELLHTEKKLAPGTEAWDKRVNDRMREIIYRTQVVDSTMTRSHLMRQKGVISGALAFMSEPTLALNMLNDAIFKVRMDARQGKKWNPATAKNVAKVMTVTATVNVFAAVVEALFSALRDDDEFEEFSEKYLNALIGDYSDAETLGDRLSAFMSSSFGSKLNLLDNIPVVSDIIDAAKSGAAEQMWQAFAGEIGEGYRAAMKVVREGGSLADYYRAVYKLMSGVSKAVGLPVSNAMRDLVSIYNTVVAEPMGWRRLQTYGNSNSEAAAALLEAQIAGDNAKIEKARERIGVYNMDQEKIAQALANKTEEAYAKGQIDRKTAAEFMTGDGGKRKRDAEKTLTYTDYLIETGLKHSDMKDDFISGAITEKQAVEYKKKYDGMRENEAEAEIAKWRYEKDTGLVYKDMRIDYIDGVLTDSQVVNYRTKYGGVTADTANATVKEWKYEKDTGLVWDDLRDDYADGIISESKLRDYLKVYGGKDAAAIDETINRYDYYAAHGTDDGYTKYWRIPYEYEHGGDYGMYIDKAYQELMYGDAPKDAGDARKAIARSLASYYKPKYLPIRDTAQGAAMLEEILDVYVAVGYGRDYERKYIAENW